MKKQNKFVIARQNQKRSRSNLRMRDCFVALLLAMTASAPSALACPACKEAISKLSEIWTGIGFSWSVLFMITVPFVLVSSFGVGIFLAIRSKQKHS